MFVFHDVPVYIRIRLILTDVPEGLLRPLRPHHTREDIPIVATGELRLCIPSLVTYSERPEARKLDFSK